MIYSYASSKLGSALGKRALIQEAYHPSLLDLRASSRLWFPRAS